MSRETEFRTLFSNHYPAVAKYVLARGYQAADADDLIAGTFEVAWRRLEAPMSSPPRRRVARGRRSLSRMPLRGALRLALSGRPVTARRPRAVMRRGGLGWLT